MTTKTHSLPLWVYIVLFVIGFLIGWSSNAGAQDRTPFVQGFIVRLHQAWDGGGVKFYELRSSKGTILLSGDADLDLLKWLAAREDKRIIFSVEELP